MSHCVHVIVTPIGFASVIAGRWPELPSLPHSSGFVLFPVDYDLIDAKIRPVTTPRDTGEEFMLLTTAFEQYLCELSDGGRIAYLETEYWGGTGGQGALVFENRKPLMTAQWATSDTINDALQLIGVPCPDIGDRFSAIGLEDVRSNEDILELIQS